MLLQVMKYGLLLALSMGLDSSKVKQEEPKMSEWLVECPNGEVHIFKHYIEPDPVFACEIASEIENNVPILKESKKEKIMLTIIY